MKFTVALLAAFTAQHAVAASRPLTCPLISELRKAESEMTVVRCVSDGLCGKIYDVSLATQLKWAVYTSPSDAQNENDAKSQALAILDHLVTVQGPMKDRDGIWYCQYYAQSPYGVAVAVTPPQEIQGLRWIKK